MRRWDTCSRSRCWRTTARRCGAWRPLYLARDSSGELLGFYRWRIAEGLHDEPALTALRAQYRQMRLPSLWRIMNYAVLDGRRMEDAESAAVAIRAKAGRSSDWQRSKTYLHAFEINRGHPAKALGDTARPDEDEYAPHTALYERVLDAMYGDGDSVNGGQAARELARLAERPAAGGSDARAVAQTDLCVVTLWRLSHGELGGAAQAITRLRSRAPGDSPASLTTDTRVRRAARGEARGRLRRGRRGGRAGSPGHPHAERARRTAQRAARGVHPEPGVRQVHGRDQSRAASRTSPTWRWLACASARATSGRRCRAVRRRPYAYHLTDYLAAAPARGGPAGRPHAETRAGAVRAYRHYLALRSDPEPALRPAVEAVRAELAKLAGNP